MPEPVKREGLIKFVSRVFVHPTEEKKSLTPPATALRVTTHVARDLLQNAAYFNSVPKAVTEYVTNAIDNASRGKPVRCEVAWARDEIRIADNASGMTFAELFNFFQMHGENIQRKRGRAVRGRFGTGKSAAFGIAGTLQIDTIKGGKRNLVELRSADVESAKDGQPIPVRELIVDQPTTARAGTTILIKNLNVKHVDADAARAYLEKNLGRHLRLHQVVVNGLPCRFQEPASDKSFRFRAPKEIAAQIGSITCGLKISQQPLGRDENVIAILCNGYLHASTLAGKQGEPFVEFIFGEVEAPLLDSETDAIPAFDNTRGLTLNPQNPRVQSLLNWLAVCVEEVRQELVARDKRRRYSKEMRLLHKVSGEIQSFLDEDFRVVQERIPWATLVGARRYRRKGRRRGGYGIKPNPDGKNLVDQGRALFHRLLGHPLDADANPPRARSVKFEINCARLGAAASRASYIPDRRAIYINRDHPQLRAAEAEAGITSRTYRMLLFDIAFTEYALAVVSQLADQGIQIADPIDASEMAQEILDRLGRKAAEKFFAEGELGASALEALEKEEAEERGAVISEQ